MSSIKNSQPCLKSELDLFYTLPTNTSIIKSSIVSYNALSLSGTEDRITISIPPTSEYTDLNDMFLSVEFRINVVDAKKDHTICSLVNNFGHCLFQTIEHEIGNETIKTKNIESATSYPYKAYLLNLLNFTEDIKSTSMKSVIWEKDEAKKFEDPLNRGFIKRAEYFEKGRKNNLKLIFPLHLDLLHSNRFLIYQRGMNFILKKNENKFMFMGKDSENFEIKIMKASILGRKCEINPAVVSAHQHAFLTNPAIYPIKQNKIYTSQIDNGLQEYEPNIFRSTILPNKLVIGLVLESAFVGDKNNPFNFQHFDVSSITLKIDSTDLTYNMDYANNNCSEPYHAMFQSLNLYNQGSNGITIDDFMGGNCLYCFNLNPDKGCDEQFNELKRGSIYLKVKFKEITPEKLRLVCLAEFDNQINIHSNVDTDFNHVI